MTASEPISRKRRLAELLPAVASIVFYGLMQERWLVAAPILLILGGAWAGQWVMREGRWRLYGSIVAGVALGYVLLTQSEPAAVAFPPLLASTAAGGLAAWTMYFALCRRVHMSWIAAWILAGVALQAPRGDLFHTPWPLIGFLVPTMLAVLFTEYPPSQSILRSPGFLVFTAVAAPISVGVAQLANATDEWILKSAEGLAQQMDPPTGLGTHGRIDLPTEDHVDLSPQVILELDGVAPDYLRTGVLEYFDGNKWTDTFNSSAGGAKPRVANARSLPPPAPPPNLQRQLDVLLFSSLGDVVPTPAGTWGIHDKASMVEVGFIWHARDPGQSDILLDTSVSELLPKELGTNPILTYLPEGLREPFAEIARKVVGDATTSQDKAKRIERFFQSEFTYSLDTNLRDGKTNPLLVFVRDHRPAFCIYFAGAMAAMLRSIDVPARVVQGFVPQERNPVTRRYVVRGADAHAWVEVFIPEEQRFIAFDPTPRLSREAALARVRPSTASSMLEAAFAVAWRIWVEVRRDPMERIKGFFKSHVTWAAVLVVGLWQFLRRQRDAAGARRRTPLAGADPTLRRVYDRYLRMLRGADLFPGPGETDEELLARVASNRGAAASAAAREFVERYRQGRYGGRPADPAELGRLLDVFRTALRRGERKAA